MQREVNQINTNEKGNINTKSNTIKVAYTKKRLSDEAIELEWEKRLRRNCKIR